MNSKKLIAWLMQSRVSAPVVSRLGKIWCDGKHRSSIPRPFKEGADFEHLRRVIMQRPQEGLVPIIELWADPEIMLQVVEWKDFPLDLAKAIMWSVVPIDDFKTGLTGIQLMELNLAFSKAVGYDFVTAWPYVPIPRSYSEADAGEKYGGKWRAWQNETKGTIPDRESFNRFPWPTTADIGLFPIRYLGHRLPPGMKVMVFYWGIFEDLKLLMGLENLAVKSIEEPELVVDIAEKLTVLGEAALEQTCALPEVGAIFFAEDMGFNQGTMLNPRFMREHIIPRQKRLAGIAHKHGKPFLLHSCGQVDAIMPDLIDTVGIDGKHSFQDTIEPVEEIYERYHERIAILGGMDMDLLSRGKTEDVRKRVRQVLSACAPGGGFAIGAGNTVASYIPIENYYAMLDETRKYNEEHGWS